MSNLLYMDESNGNGVYAARSADILTDNGIGVSDHATSTTTTTSASPTEALAMANNINIMNGSAIGAASLAAALPTSVSSEDLSQSLSEYTDADESISAPTEFLAEFLSAVMLKDYKKALKYCKLILQYEPNNGTAKEFYPLILDKLRVAASTNSDENYNKSSSPELALELQGSDEAASDEPNSQHDSQALSSNSNSSCNNCSDEPLSLSECDDDEVGEPLDDDEDDDEDDDVMSSSGDDLPIDEQLDVAAVGDLAATSHNCSGSSRNSSSGGGGRSDNTTHSYSSLLLEEEDDIVPASLQFCNREATVTDLDVSNGNKAPSGSCSDSESPTEPLTQRLAAILRSKCGVAAGNDEHY